MSTVRQMVAAIQHEVQEPELAPTRAAALLLKATALLGNVTQEIRDADAAYAHVLLDCLQTEAKANRARIVAETTPAYARKRQARDTHELLVEVCRSLKVYIRAASDEMELAR